jgi:uncharacterized SAM-binding protein YcdF (DUF218 family)
MRFNHATLIQYFVVFISFLLIFSSCSYSSRKSVKLLAHAEKNKYDLIVVPGLPLENGKWSPLMQARIYWAKYLLDREIAYHVMFSGNAVYTPYVEAEVMARYAEAIGIPPNRIYRETKAEHSTENIYYSYQKARNLGFRRIALATDPFQSRMLRRFIFTRINDQVGIIPIVFDSLKSIESQVEDPVLDFDDLKVEPFTPLPERKTGWQRMRGTMGKNIDYE